MNTCINCKTIIDDLIEENNKEYDSLKIIYNLLSVERTILKNNSYLMMNILFFLINNYIGVITCENYLMNEEILNSHIEFMNLLIEKCNFILIYEKENINFELINEIYHLKDDKIYFKKIKYNTEKNKIEYTLEEPLERDDIDMKLWNIDDIYERNDAIRFHSKFDIIEKNIKTIYAVPNVKIVMMPSISVFSMPFLDEYVNYCKKIFGKDEYCIRWSFGQNVITGPQYLSPFMLDQSYEKYIDSAINVSNKIKVPRNKLGNHIAWVRHLVNIKKNLGKYNDKKWWVILNGFASQRADSRSGVNILDTFPHLQKNINEYK